MQVCLVGVDRNVVLRLISKLSSGFFAFLFSHRILGLFFQVLLFVLVLDWSFCRDLLSLAKQLYLFALLSWFLGSVIARGSFNHYFICSVKLISYSDLIRQASLIIEIDVREDP